MSSSSSVVQPLSLSKVQTNYPHLYREFTYLSNREKESMEDIGDIDGTTIPIDPVTNLCTTISFTNFTEPLEDNDDCPMKTNSAANKFCTFLFKCLLASESGSVGGDACRQFDILYASFDDILLLSRSAVRSSTSLTFQSKFEHLLGWTAAATNHGLHALLYRGDPDRNRSLFMAVGDEWKKVFDKIDINLVVDEAYRKFAIWICDCFEKLLKNAKEEYGDYAKYSFNFIKKKRVSRNNGGEVSAVVALAASVSAESSTSIVQQPTNKTITTRIIVTKQSKDSKLGLGIAQKKGMSNHIKITSIAPNSLFANTELKVGNILLAVNAQKFSTFAQGSTLLKRAVGKLSIDISQPASSTASGGKRKADASSDDDSTKKRK